LTLDKDPKAAQQEADELAELITAIKKRIDA
jgi:hypothetical protein